MPSNTNSQGQSKGGFWAALASAGAGLVTGLGNIFSGKKRDERQQKWANSMYEKQKADELAFWEKNNMYNSPQAQMLRLKEAGLNPNLVYGNGAVANSSSAPSVPSPQQVQFQPREFNFDAQSHIMQFYDIKAKTAQLDILTEQKVLMQKEALLKDAQTFNTIANTDTTKFDLSQKQRLADTSFQYQQEMLRKLQSDIVINQNRDNREKTMNDQNVQESISRIALNKLALSKNREEIKMIRANINNTEARTAMQEIENQMAKKGIFRNDPMYLRMAQSAAEKAVNGEKDWWSNLLDWVKNK